MNTILDYLSSLFFGGVLLSIILSANDIASENHSVYNGDMLVQEMMAQTAHLVEGEFRNMGVGVAETNRSVLAADTSSIRFLYDVDRNGTPDTVTYALGAASELPGTQNELDRPLYRRVSGGTAGAVGVVTLFHLQYMTRLGEILPTPVPAGRLSEIHTVEVTMEVQNPYAVLRKAGERQAGDRDAIYSSSLWQQTRLASMNARR